MGGKRKHIKGDEQKSVWWLQTSSNAMEALCFIFFDIGREVSTTAMTAEWGFRVVFKVFWAIRDDTLSECRFQGFEALNIVPSVLSYSLKSRRWCADLRADDICL